MRATLCATAFCLLFASPAAAEMLLASFTWSNPEPVTLPASYGFYVEAYSHDHDFWSETVNSFPFHSFAPPELVRALDYPIANPGNYNDMLWIRMTNGDQGPERKTDCASCWSDRLLGIDPGWADFVTAKGWDVDVYVPLGDWGFLGYYLTNIERLVTAQSQTIRLYGTVPEPASWLLLVVGLLHVSRRCRA